MMLQKRDYSVQFLLRPVLLGALGSMIITASSMYVALKMSALPWPTVFVAVLSMGILRFRGKTNLHEVNIAQTGMSAGAMVAGGLAFTMPGLWINGIFKAFDPAKESLSQWLLPKFWPILLITLGGTLLGSVFCWLLRPRFIVDSDLPFPIGGAAAETLQAGDEGGSKGKLLFASLGLVSLFTFLRDFKSSFGLGKDLIPSAFSGKIGAFPLSLALSPMASGIGYLIGFRFTLIWLLGGLLSNWLLPQLTFFSDATTLSVFVRTSAIGLMLGSGLSILINLLINQFKKAKVGDKHASPAERAARLPLLNLILAALAFVLTVLAGLPLFASVLVIAGTVLATAMSATITGQTGINPMETFGILVLLGVRALLPLDNTQAFLVAGIVAITCGFAGDMLNDYKIGQILGTDAKSQMISQLVGGIVGALVAVPALFAIILKFGGVGGETGLTAAQAHSVSFMVKGIGEPKLFALACAVGLILSLLKFPAMIFSIGMLLPLGSSVAIFLGGLAEFIVRKLKPEIRESVAAKAQVVAAGLLGGEGLTSTLLAIISMFMGLRA